MHIVSDLSTLDIGKEEIKRCNPGKEKHFVHIYSPNDLLSCQHQRRLSVAVGSIDFLSAKRGEELTRKIKYTNTDLCV